jgi:hypothetical protein
MCVVATVRRKGEMRVKEKEKVGEMVEKRERRMKMKGLERF